MDRSLAHWKSGVAVSAAIVTSLGLVSWPAFGLDLVNDNAGFQNFHISVSADSGNPIQGARVRLYKGTGETVASLVTDQRGEAAAKVDRGTYRVVAVKRGFQVTYGLTTVGAPYGCGPGTRCPGSVTSDYLLVVLKPGITSVPDNQVWLCGSLVNPFETASAYVTCNGPATTSGP